MKPLILNESGTRVPRKFLEAWVKALTRELSREISPKRFKGKELGIVFLDTRKARALNKQYRRKDYATDILSFTSDDESSLGELVICPSVIRKQSLEHGLTYQEELGYMVIHGVLHLLGYDHEQSEKDAKKMFAIQDRVFAILI